MPTAVMSATVITGLCTVVASFTFADTPVVPPVPTSEVPYVQTAISTALTSVPTPANTPVVPPTPTTELTQVATVIAAALSAIPTITPQPTATVIFTPTLVPTATPSGGGPPAIWIKRR